VLLPSVDVFLLDIPDIESDLERYDIYPENRINKLRNRRHQHICQERMLSIK